MRMSGAVRSRKKRSPELERLIRTLEVVATDLPRILRQEKAVAFERLDSVESYEAHMRQISRIPEHLEALSRTIGLSLQVEGATDHLSRIFRAISTSRGVTLREAPVPVRTVTSEGGASDPSDGVVVPSDLMSPLAIRKTSTDQRENAPEVLSHRVNPDTGDLQKEETSEEVRFHPMDLNLQKVRDAIVPGGGICGRSMYESSRARLVTARASGDGPWRFQFRRGSLEWAAQGVETGLRGVAALICADRGYIQVPAELLLQRAETHLMRSTGGNPILRPSVAVFGSEAILHPGAMAKTRPGEATKHAFVEF
jgi:hypothetical protein